MAITSRPRRIDHMIVGTYMFEAERWVAARMGYGKTNPDGKSIVVNDATRPPYAFGDVREGVWATAVSGDYILHNGYGQFRILTKAQFDYWYQEAPE